MSDQDGLMGGQRLGHDVGYSISREQSVWSKDLDED